MALATVGVSFTALTVTTKVSSAKSVPASVARTTMVAVPLESAAKSRLRLSVVVPGAMATVTARHSSIAFMENAAVPVVPADACNVSAPAPPLVPVPVLLTPLKRSS